MTELNTHLSLTSSGTLGFETHGFLRLVTKKCLQCEKGLEKDKREIRMTEANQRAECYQRGWDPASQKHKQCSQLSLKSHLPDV